MSGATTGGRQYIAAGMFLFATLGFVVVQIDRQRKQRIQQVTGSRTEYLRYLGNVRKVAREAADQQRRALTWHHPDPSALPALAEDRTRVWEHGSGDPQFLHVRYGVCHQPLSLELVPPESAPIDQVDPAAASALHRLLVVHRLQPDLPASVDLRAFDRIEICGPEEPARSLARAHDLLGDGVPRPRAPRGRRAQHRSRTSPTGTGSSGSRTPRAPSSPTPSARGGWCRPRSTTWPALLPADLGERPRFGADERPATPHILLVIDGGELPPGNHVVPPDGLHGVTVLDLPERWDELEDPTRLRLQFEARTSRPTAAATRCRRCGCATS